MKTKIVIIAFIIIVLSISGYIVNKDRKIKQELANIQQASFVKQNDMQVFENTIDSEILVKRANGKTEVFTSGSYFIKPESVQFTFTGYKPGGEHTGTFNTIESTISLNSEGNPVQVLMTIDPKSVQTDSPKLDQHLQAKEFFDTAQYSEISIFVKEFKKENQNIFAITDLTMKGITKTVSIPVQIAQTGDSISFVIDTRINISDYGIAYGPVFNEVRITAQSTINK